MTIPPVGHATCPVFQLATTAPFIPPIQFLSSRDPSLTMCYLKATDKEEPKRDFVKPRMMQPYAVGIPWLK